jgi:fimbrial chaperone protein
MRRLSALTVCVLGLVFQAGNVSGSAFKVTPVRVTFSGPSSTLLTLKNESDQPLRFQISSFAWQQDPKGEVKLEPSEDIVFFPALLILGPGEERKVRVAATVAAQQVEKTYRIFFEELPGLEKPGQTSGAQVKILTKMGIPIFVTPEKGNAQAVIENGALAAGALSFDVRNSGNIHFGLQRVKIRGIAADGQTAFERELDGWYVLAGSPRTYQLEVPADACRRIKTVAIEAETDIASIGNSGTISRTFDVAPGGCK